MKTVLIYSGLTILAVLALAFQNFATVKASERADLRQKSLGTSCPYEAPTKSMHPLK